MRALPPPQDTECQRTALLASAWALVLVEYAPPGGSVVALPAQLTTIARRLVASTTAGPPLSDAAWTCGSALADLCGPHPQLLGRLGTATLDCLRDSEAFAGQLPTLLGYLATGFLAPRAPGAISERAAVNRLAAESREEAQQELARELHDGALQVLIGISYQMGRRLATVPDQEMRAMRQSVLDVVVQLRALVGELRPAGLEELGLATALEGYISRLRRETGSEAPEIVLDIVEDSPELALPAARCIFRVAQEGLRNILRHARASQVTIELRVGREEATLTVRDDGTGFNIPPSLSALARSNHFGLVGMAERVALAEGQLSIRSQPGQGTVIFLRLPTTIGAMHDQEPRTTFALTPPVEATASEI